MNAVEMLSPNAGPRARPVEAEELPAVVRLKLTLFEEAGRSHVLASPEQAARVDDVSREEWLTFVVVGGGPAGVEYAGTLAELLRRVLGRTIRSVRPGAQG